MITVIVALVLGMLVGAAGAVLACRNNPKVADWLLKKGGAQ